MGTSASKRVSQTLNNSSEFNSACSTTFTHFLSLTQRSFPGIFPYQLHDASLHLHHSLSSTYPLITKWAPSPPSSLLVDRAYNSTIRRRRGTLQETLDCAEFKYFAVELFTIVVVGNARKEMVRKIPVGVVGIVGVGLAGKVGKELLGTVIGVYALGVATFVYLSLS